MATFVRENSVSFPLEEDDHLTEDQLMIEFDKLVKMINSFE